VSCFWHSHRLNISTKGWSCGSGFALFGVLWGIYYYIRFCKWVHFLFNNGGPRDVSSGGNFFLLVCLILSFIERACPAHIIFIERIILWYWISVHTEIEEAFWFWPGKIQFEASYYESPKIGMQCMPASMWSMLDSRGVGACPPQENFKIVCSEIESECIFSYNYHTYCSIYRKFPIIGTTQLSALK